MFKLFIFLVNWLLSMVVFFPVDLYAKEVFSTEQIIMDSWITETVEDLVSTWGRPDHVTTLPNTTKMWLVYSDSSSVYVPPSIHTNTKSNVHGYISPYGNYSGNVNTYSNSYTTGGYNINFSCTVEFEADSATNKITFWRYNGNRCKEWYVYPAHVSIKWLNAIKTNKVKIQDYEVLQTEKGLKVTSVRKDSIIYKNGLRRSMYIEKQEPNLLVVKKYQFPFSKKFRELSLTYKPTWHSVAYEGMSKKQRRIFGVDD